MTGRLALAATCAPILVMAGIILAMPHHQLPPGIITAAPVELGASAQIPGTFPLELAASAQIPGTFSAQQPASTAETPGTTSTSAASQYKNPIGSGLTPQRVDMGVDYGGTGPLYALGNGTITNLYNSGWPDGTFIGLHLSDGSYVYYAESITPEVQVGQTVSAGHLLGYATGGGIEVGWAARPGTGQTMADLTGQDQAGLAQGDPGYYPTGYGVNFSNLIQSLGGPPGIIDGPVQG